jgi:hypothetical protein
VSRREAEAALPEHLPVLDAGEELAGAAAFDDLFDQEGQKIDADAGQANASASPRRWKSSATTASTGIVMNVPYCISGQIGL